MRGSGKDPSASKPHTFLRWFYEEYARFVYKLAWQADCDGCDVEDLVQEVWLRLCTKESLLMELSKERHLAYIAATVKNTAISMARKHTREYPLEFAYMHSFDEAAILNSVLDRQIKIQNFYAVWGQVPPAAREILERKYMLFETDAEIAEALGIRTNSVRMYLTRARKTAYAILLQHKDELI